MLTEHKSWVSQAQKPFFFVEKKKKKQKQKKQKERKKKQDMTVELS